MKIFKSYTKILVYIYVKLFLETIEILHVFQVISLHDNKIENLVWNYFNWKWSKMMQSLQKSRLYNSNHMIDQQNWWCNYFIFRGTQNLRRGSCYHVIKNMTITYDTNDTYDTFGTFVICGPVDTSIIYCT